MARIANFCATCGKALLWRRHSGRERPYCRECQTPIYFDPKVAVVVFIARDDKVLLIRRAVNPGKGKWALPAGFVDHDEAPAAAAAREVWEETALRARIDKLLDVFPRKDEGLADIVIAYSATILSGQPRAGDDAADLGWFSRHNLPELVFYPSITLTARWRAGALEA